MPLLLGVVVLERAGQPLLADLPVVLDARAAGFGQGDQVSAAAWLGGKDNYPVDQAAAELAVAANTHEVRADA